MSFDKIIDVTAGVYFQSYNKLIAQVGLSYLQSKMFTTCFFCNPSYCPSHHKAHTNTPARPYTIYHPAVSYNSVDAGLVAITAAAYRRNRHRCAFLSSLCQQRVSNDVGSPRCRCHFANLRYVCCRYGGTRLSETTRT